MLTLSHNGKSRSGRISAWVDSAWEGDVARSLYRRTGSKA